MKVISILIKTDRFVIRNTKTNININTNQVTDYTLFYTPNYIKRNKKIIKELLDNKNIDTCSFDDFDLFLFLYPIIASPKVIFENKKSLTPKIMDLLFDNENLKEIECYFMPSDYVHIASNKNISVKFNNDLLFTMEFVDDNEFKNMKNIYYKKVVSFFSLEEVEKNLKNFLRINTHLEVINLYCYSNKIIKYVVDTLKETNHEYVDIFIYQNQYNTNKLTESADYLRKISKKYKEIENGREIRVVYSDNYLKNNFFKQMTLNGVKLVMVATLYIGTVFLISNRYHEYIALINIRLLESTLASSLENVQIDEMDDEDINPPVEEPTIDDTPEVETPPQVQEYVNHYTSIQEATFDKLLTINKDVKGWLVVNNTKINYPVTQGPDNDYYLSHDIYNKKITTGWVFMDYRNDALNLSDNTIIYGHNLKTGYMFGSLKNALDYSWYTNPANQIITFNTINKDMKWRVFSIYRTDYTTDYLKANFSSTQEFLDFASSMKSRSIYDFGINVKEGDKILTLSTCTGNNRRMVIHAVLIG